MAEGTRSRLQQDTLQCQVDVHEETLQTMNERLDQLTDMMRTFMAHQNNSINRDLEVGLEGDQMHNRGGFPRSIRIDFPHFDGDNPSGWIFKANQYFEIHQTSPNQKLLLASYHMEGEALIWYQDAWESGQLTSWEVFVRALLLRFCPTAYDDPMEALTRLKQTTTVAAYKSQFESLSNRLRGLSDHHKLSCFLSGLKDEIRLPIRMFYPINLGAAFGLAKIQEEYLMATRRSLVRIPYDKGFSVSNTTSNPVGQHSDSGNKVGKYIPPNRNFLSTTMDEKRRKGLCCHCNEKWSPAHHCQSPKVYLLHAQEDGTDLGEGGDMEGEGEKEEVQQTVGDQPEVEISLNGLNAMAGIPNSQTMRLVGSIQGEEVVVLISSGSTHNFMDPWVARKTKLPVVEATTISVKIANGDIVQGEGQCKKVPIKLQGTHFDPSFYLLKLGGCDIVMGVSWLQTLGPIVWDFSKLTMKFGEGKKRVMFFFQQH